MRMETMYRVLVATIFILLMTVGIYIGVELSSKDTPYIEEVMVSNTDNVKIYNDVINKEEKEKIIDVDNTFTDIYPECGHSFESVEHHKNTTIESMKKQIEQKDITYKIVGQKDNMILYEKVHLGKCLNHYKVCLENDVVCIYRINEQGKFGLYQTTEITSTMLRDGIREQLEKGIFVDDIEELFLLMEDIES